MNTSNCKLALVLIIGLISFNAYAQEAKNPAVKNYGGVYELPFEALKPDPNLQYKIVIDIYTGADKPDEINPALFNAARMLNLHAVGGVPKENMDVVLAIHGPAAFTVMDNEAYMKKYSTDNPNLSLITELDKAGVKLYICGQSLLVRKIDVNRIAKEIKPALSMLTIVTSHQLQGYAFMKF
jgi:intracellular sulfur oxidation DsrE/DsrF family protein